jgi:hypothetical protein
MEQFKVYTDPFLIVAGLTVKTVLGALTEYNKLNKRVNPNKIIFILVFLFIKLELKNEFRLTLVNRLSIDE